MPKKISQNFRKVLLQMWVFWLFCAPFIQALPADSNSLFSDNLKKELNGPFQTEEDGNEGNPMDGKEKIENENSEHEKFLSGPYNLRANLAGVHFFQLSKLQYMDEFPGDIHSPPPELYS